ncbi:hypothetical protein AWB85_20280 [Mycobacteroides immunogenum]|uniref:Terminase n=1 Tax=Mycobacteroides immunogenum TaxID=83262 RepID=A0A179VCH1_9MYCO|nr:hypothetical protein [Mycobacteroides immunogenum]OAT69579.1 hypothetical protein AWB85_20280 [Mycobacteroides immunogenum]
MPKGLDYQGKKLWTEITRIYDLSAEPHKRRLLRDACEMADLIDTLDKAMVGKPLTVKGSMGQQVINPLVSQVQQAREALARQLSRLNFADAEEDDYETD